ncbi:glutaredoxin family protein [Ktedonospora formicarum]|uniref:NrdH-redoxin n=1 Tax=Ktedonospora formicarum TaxID=2778364 RepID=A0A8J3MQM6_9CHLR|nr:glutaredoxin domain-containing protein [Ktedonospora formicarum]GHO42763.1 NrdH-redoxin [Ktedonospora formicarum]
MPDTTVNDTKIKVYSTTWCGDCRMAKRWFDSHGIAYEDINVEQDKQAEEAMLKVNGGRWVVPTIVLADGSILTEPSARELAEKFPQQ